MHVAYELVIRTEVFELAIILSIGGSLAAVLLHCSDRRI